ncbi:electron transport complex subunit RsxE [Paucidesulfovibrio longus]|uniref:electron transport complex subunit RsxE n=1 Tax=Paucidesulfovibrio longus TaxID=889 RepID=UPI0003B5FDCD|nr:electron transport complex subunit E [Paucidesulfovibrio longus]
MHRIWKEFVKGLWKELPPFRVVLGLCPTLAVTSSAENGLGMGLAVVFVLTLSNLLVSLLRNLIPSKVRIACFILIAASLVVTVELLMQAYAYPLYQKLGIFVPLIVVNCIILGRAEAFASKNPVLASVADALGMGLGFTMSLTVLGCIRELFGNGTVFGAQVAWDTFAPFSIMVQAPGAFLCLGLILAGMNAFSGWYSRRHEGPPPRAVEAIASCSSPGAAHLAIVEEDAESPANGTNGSAD